MGALAAPFDDSVEYAIEEVAADLDEIKWLAAGARSRLAAARGTAQSRRDAFRSRTLLTYLAQARSAEAALASYEEDASEALRGARGRPAARLARLEAARADLADLVRMQISFAAGLVAGADWQSPAFRSAAMPAAGRVSGDVVEHHDDYKRDRHADAASLEAIYATTFGGAPGVGALLTSCGMSAFTTILGYMEHERLVSGRVVVGRGLYHECRDLLRSSSLGRAVVEVDEHDSAGLIRALDDGGALFLDVMCNARGLALCDLRRVLRGAARRDITVVIDTTCASVTCRPFTMLPPGARGRLLVFESLTKYAQFGLDRTAAGLILARPGDRARLDTYREHLGTNIGDVAACTLPVPERARLVRRLGRIGRNAAVIAARINGVVQDGRGTVTGACYPGFATHPGYATAAGLSFPGGLVAVELRPGADRPEIQGELVELMLRAAERRGAPLAAGASFGFDVTRVYRTAIASDQCPFVRIAPGIEHTIAAERVAGAIADACGSL